ncbi:hypothetical protein D9M68_940860 [compost metagenome]
MYSSLAMRVEELPLAKVSWPCRDFASAVRSASVRTGLSGGTTSTSPLLAISEAGAKSLTGSYGSFLNSEALAACVVLVVTSMV